MKKEIINLLLLVSTLSLTVPTFIYAQDTPATDSGTMIKDEIRQKLKERLDNNDQSDAAETTPRRSVFKWYAEFGTIKQATGSSFTVENTHKKLVNVVIDDDTELSLLKSGSKKTIKTEDIEPDWFAIAMGSTPTSNGTFTAKRVTFSTQVTTEVKKSVTVGKVTEIDETTVTLTNGKTETITIPKQYTLTIRGAKTSKLEDVSINDKAVAIVEDEVTVDKKTKEEKIIKTLKSLYIVPGVSNPKSANTDTTPATTSAEPTKTEE